MREVFAIAPSIFVFLHVLSAVLWIGGMVALRFALHPNLQLIEDGKQRLGMALSVMGKFFKIITIFIAIIVTTGLFMVLAMDFKSMGLGGFVHVKEAIWTIMTINFIYMNIVRNKAQKLFNDGEINKAKETAQIIASRLIPANILLGVVAIYVGVILRGW